MPNIASGSAAIAAIDTEIDLKGSFKNVQIWTNAGSADVHIDLNGTAAAAADGANTVRLVAGRANGFISNGQMSISKIRYIGATATGRINWVATP